jgi:glycosyltransferase involved in cell wall biosynthesis
MEQKVRVLFIQAQREFESVASVNALLMRYFDRERVEVHVAYSASIERDETSLYKVLKDIPNISLRPTNFGPTFSQRSKIGKARELVVNGFQTITSMLGLARYVKRHNINIIHVSTTAGRDAICGALLSKLTGVKTVVPFHYKYDTWMSRRTFWAMRRAGAIVGVSNFVAQSVIANGYSPDKVYHVLNGIEIDRWRPETDGSAIRNEFGIAPDAPVLAIVGNLLPWKGHEQLLQALARVKEAIPTIKLLIVGKDAPEAIGGKLYSPTLQKMVDELGLREQVIFTGQRKDVVNMFAACDLYAMPTFEEPFGLVFLEAMAMKKAIVAVESGGVPEVVEHGKSGLLSPVNDNTRLAENIISLLNDPLRRVQMGNYGRQRVEEYFNAQRMADDMEHTYRLIAGLKEPSQSQQTPLIELSVS